MQSKERFPDVPRIFPRETELKEPARNLAMLFSARFFHIHKSHILMRIYCKRSLYVYKQDTSGVFL